MIIENLTPQVPTTYTSNVYLVRGTHNAIPDVNTLIDVGRDPQVIDAIQKASTGVGKKRIAQVILTHSHYDHASLLPEIKRLFSPIAYAFAPIEGVDRTLRGGETMRMGDEYFEIIYLPGHSHDSVCIFCPHTGDLFSGDTPLNIRTRCEDYSEEFIKGIEKLSQLKVRTIYPGHGNPITNNVQQMISDTHENIR